MAARALAVAALLAGSACAFQAASLPTARFAKRAPVRAAPLSVATTPDSASKRLANSTSYLATRASSSLSQASTVVDNIVSTPQRIRKRDRVRQQLKTLQLKLVARNAAKVATTTNPAGAAAAAAATATATNDNADVAAKQSRMRSALRRLGSVLAFRRTRTAEVTEGQSIGEALEAGWEKRGSGSALTRNVEVWKFGASSALKVLKANKLKDEEERKIASTAAAEFIRDGLVKLGPTFVKLGQVLSTRTDIFSAEYINVLKTLQDDVPGFSGARARAIIAKELGKPVDQVFQQFEDTPLAAASLGQVHTAVMDGQKVAIKVQRAGLKELFDVDLKNLKKLAVLLDKFDPKSDGADRDWVSIYDESARLLYLEIDYLNEAKNAARFAEDFKGTDWIRTPKVYENLSTPRVLVMEFVESLKLTDIPKIEKLGLDRKLLAQRSAESFLAQVLRTGYFHCDPHPGNLAVDSSGNLVYYDYGMMDELKPRVREGFRNLCFALFEGGPFIDDTELARQGKRFVLALEQMGVLAKGADQLAVEKFARYIIRNFKNVQLGKTSGGIKSTIGTDLQTLTEANVFRFPSTFTFIFRAFASIDGIGKGLDTDFDIGKLAQPFVEELTQEAKYSGDSELGKVAKQFASVTGLNAKDVNTAVSQPRKVAYLEETVRAMEQGNLKIRVRSLENEKALERMALTQDRLTNLVAGGIFVNLGLSVANRIPKVACFLAAGYFGSQVLGIAAKLKIFDKKAKQFQQTEFADDAERQQKKNQDS